MFYVFQIFILSGIHLMVAKCLIPDLSVQMLDRRLIDRKRQDTLDMCRLFTSETEKLNAVNEGNSEIKRRRSKRDTNGNQADMEEEKAKRVESIVDKLYDDVEENGQKVTYRQREFPTTSAPARDFQNRTGRRFNFAPAELLGPAESTTEGTEDLKHDEPTGPEWPKKWKHGIVPYFIDPKTYDAQLAEVVMKAFDYFEKATCIRLQRLKDKPTDLNSLHKVEWLYIANPSGIRQCVHSNERKANRGVQVVVFGYDCMSLGEIVHEVMHILGFSHEHSRPDRDQHITVFWNNIKPGYRKYFEVRPFDALMNIPYDYASVLHYPSRAFSKNGQVTIMSQPGVKLGQREGLSDGDIEKVSTIYGHECVERNREYLLKTCPSVVNAVKPNLQATKVTKRDIVDYFKDRLWPYGVVNYKLRDHMEFSDEERENIKAVIRHIQKETCIEFRDVSADEDEPEQEPNEPPENEKAANSSETRPGISDGNEKSDANANDRNEGAPSEDKDNPPMETTTPQEESVTNGEDTENTQDKSPSASPEPKSAAENEINPRRTDVEKKKLIWVTNKTTTAKGSKRKGNSKTLKKKVLKEKVAPKPGRRHAADILILARSVEPGCACPTPGKPGGNKVLYINADCFNSVNDLLHLFVHLLGLDHQHNMHDRDFFLQILWDKLTPDVKEEMKVKLPPAASLGYDYDYQSVMHYPWLQIKNGVTNIMYPIWNDGWAMGHWQGLSSTDVFKLNQLYFDECIERKKNREKN